MTTRHRVRGLSLLPCRMPAAKSAGSNANGSHCHATISAMELSGAREPVESRKATSEAIHAEEARNRRHQQVLPQQRGDGWHNEEWRDHEDAQDTRPITARSSNNAMPRPRPMLIARTWAIKTRLLPSAGRKAGSVSNLV